MSIYIKIGNVANAILLCFVGVWAMITVNSDADALLTVLASAYVITFSLILFSWELKFECCNVCFLKNMGFMFNWAGRCLFFVFVGTLSFGLGLPGVIVGVFTFVNMCWNVFVVCVNPGYFEALREKARRELEQAVKTENVVALHLHLIPLLAAAQIHNPLHVFRRPHHHHHPLYLCTL